MQKNHLALSLWATVPFPWYADAWKWFVNVLLTAIRSVVDFRKRFHSKESENPHFRHFEGVWNWRIEIPSFEFCKSLETLCSTKNMLTISFHKHFTRFGSVFLKIEAKDKNDHAFLQKKKKKPNVHEATRNFRAASPLLNLYCRILTNLT